MHPFLGSDNTLYHTRSSPDRTVPCARALGDLLSHTCHPIPASTSPPGPTSLENQERLWFPLPWCRLETHRKEKFTMNLNYDYRTENCLRTQRTPGQSIKVGECSSVARIQVENVAGSVRAGTLGPPPHCVPRIGLPSPACAQKLCPWVFWFSSLMLRTCGIFNSNRAHTCTCKHSVGRCLRMLAPVGAPGRLCP